MIVDGSAVKCKRIREPNLLVVEGREEELFFTVLIERLGLRCLQVLEIGGKTRLRERLKGLFPQNRDDEQVVSLGVVRDADDSPEGALDSVKSALRAADLAVPDAALISAGCNPRVSIMVLPGPGQRGKLEDLCLKSVENTCPMICVEEHFQRLQNECELIPKDISKAKVEVYLGSQEIPDLRLGHAAAKGYWPFDHDAFGQLRAFLTQVCGVGGEKSHYPC